MLTNLFGESEAYLTYWEHRDVRVNPRASSPGLKLPRSTWVSCGSRSIPRTRWKFASVESLSVSAAMSAG